MSAAVAQRSSPHLGRPSSRTSSPMDSKKNNNNVKKEDNPPTTHNEEPNPFEQSFGNPATDTPGKSLLPPVAALASPAIPGISASGGFNWANSLRSGPLSPAMLAGPAGNDYFDVTRGFPTPTESSLRTGLTPGGGGSMFPAPSPGTQALFQSLQANGTATPSTLDFHRTALNAAAARKGQGFNATTSAQDSDAMVQTTMDSKPQNGPQDNFAQHDATDAANGLFMLAKGAQHANNQYPPPQQVNQQSQAHHGRMNSDANTRASLDSSNREHSGEVSDSGAKGKGRGKKGKGTPASNGKRKAEEVTPAKSAKKSKAAAIDPMLEDESEEEEDDMDGPDTRKMTDEEKRKNFLERNRVAALKCRQRKKQWLANLQAKVELFSSDNDALSAQVTQLREEIVGLKTLLIAHKDCPIAQAQGISNLVLSGLQGDFAHAHAGGMGNGAGMGNGNPYGMAGMGGMQR